MSQKKQSAGVIAAKRKAAKLRAYKIEHAKELAERAKLKQAKFNAKKLASKKEPKDSSHYKPAAFTAAGLIQIALVQQTQIEATRRKKQSIVDKDAHKAYKKQFKLEHPQRTIVSTLQVSISDKSRKERRLACKGDKSAPKAILLNRARNAA